MIFIDNGKLVKEFYTSKKIERAVEVLLKADEDLMTSETFEGYTVAIVEREDKYSTLKFTEDEEYKIEDSGEDKIEDSGEDKIEDSEEDTREDKIEDIEEDTREDKIEDLGEDKIEDTEEVVVLLEEDKFYNKVAGSFFRKKILVEDKI